MIGEFDINNKSFISRAIPDVYVRTIVVGSDKLTIVLGMERFFDWNHPSESGIFNSLLERLKIKLILTSSEEHYSNIANMEPTLSKDFNDIPGTLQTIVDGKYIKSANYSFENLFARKTTAGSLLEEFAWVVGLPYEDQTFQSIVNNTNMSTENPSFLALVAFSYLEDETHYNQEETLGRYTSIGNLTADEIFRNHRIPENYALYDQDCGSLWTNTRFHRMLGDSFMAGREHGRTPSNISLNAVRVSNFKVKDLRPLIVGLKPKQSTQESGETSPATWSRTYVSLQPPSEENSNGSVRLAFGIDCEQVFGKNIDILNKFVMNPAVTRDLMKYIRIANLDITRISGVFGAGATGGDHDSVIWAVDSPSGTLIAGKSSTGSIKEIFLQSGGINDQIRFFTVTDYLDPGARAGTGPEIKYLISIEFENRIGEWISDTALKPLERVYADLDEALQFVHARLPLSLYQGLWPRYKQLFIDHYGKRLNALFARCVGVYVEKRALIEELTVLEQKELKRNLTASIHLKSGRPGGIWLLRNHVHQLISQFREYYDSIGAKNQSATNTEAAANVDQKVLNSFTISQETEAYDLYNCLNSGQDHLFNPGQKINGTGLATISKSHWQQLIEEQDSKYPGFSTAGNNQNAYLPPIYVQSGGNIINIGQVNIFNFIGFDSYLSNSNKEMIFGGQSNALYGQLGDSKFNQEAAVLELADLASDKSLEVLNDIELQGIMEDGYVEGENNQDSFANVYVDGEGVDDSQRENIKFIKGTADASGVYAALYAAAAILADVLATGIAQANSGINNAGNNSNTPNQIVALANNNIPSFQNNDGNFQINGSNKAEWNMKYENFELMQALVGFNTGIRDEIWQTMTNETVEQLGTAYSAVLVQHAGTYTNSNLGIGQGLGDACSVYHKYFILGNPDQRIASSMRPGTAATAMIKNTNVYPEFTTSLPDVLKSRRTKRATASESYKREMIARIEGTASGTQTRRARGTSARSSRRTASARGSMSGGGGGSSY
jgi:hypothetical protein